MYLSVLKCCLGLTLICSTILTVTYGEEVDQPTGICYSCDGQSECDKKIEEDRGDAYGFGCTDSNPFCNKGHSGDSHIETIFNAFKKNATNFKTGCCYCRTCAQNCKKGCVAPAVDLCGADTRRECMCAQKKCSANADCKGKCTDKQKKLYCKDGKCSCLDKSYCERGDECGNYCDGKGKYTICSQKNKCYCTNRVRDCSTHQQCKDKRAQFSSDRGSQCTGLTVACCFRDGVPADVLAQGIGDCACSKGASCPSNMFG